MLLYELTESYFNYIAIMLIYATVHDENINSNYKTKRFIKQKNKKMITTIKRPSTLTATASGPGPASAFGPQGNYDLFGNIYRSIESFRKLQSNVHFLYK